MFRPCWGWSLSVTSHSFIRLSLSSINCLKATQAECGFTSPGALLTRRNCCRFNVWLLLFVFRVWTIYLIHVSVCCGRIVERIRSKPKVNNTLITESLINETLMLIICTSSICFYHVRLLSNIVLRLLSVHSSSSNGHYFATHHTDTHHLNGQFCDCQFCISCEWWYDLWDLWFPYWAGMRVFGVRRFAVASVEI